MNPNLIEKKISADCTNNYVKLKTNIACMTGNFLELAVHLRLSLNSTSNSFTIKLPLHYTSIAFPDK
jgi:hypothetical protein